MKSLRTKVILSAFVLLFALVATIGSTYAWFTVSSTVNVETLNIDVTTQDSLLIRLYDGESQGTADTWVATDFAHSVSETDITGSTTYADFATYELFPMTALTTSTTTNGTDYTVVSPSNLSYIDINNATDRELTAGTANTDAGGYIELKFWVMSQSQGHTITLEDLSITPTDSTSVDEAISVGTIEDDNTSNTHVFSLDPDYAFAFTASDTGYLPENASYQNDDLTTFWNSVKTPATLVGLNSLFLATDVANVSTATPASAATVATLVADQVELVTVRIWVEGWDLDANNDIIAANFNISFKFTIKA